ncbi:MAG: hypothetical protein HZA36_01320 [Parcubacteria group bacterium]|nr:hypothetical protein [Parcubacteria group bacterium]
MQKLKLQFKIQKLFVPCFVFLFFCSTTIPRVQAAPISYDREVQPETEARIDFVLRIENRNINTLGGEIRYDPTMLEFRGVDDARSVVSVWIEKFKIDNGVIRYAGMIPGGYQNEHVFIGTLLFKTKNDGVTTLFIENTKVFLHDGVGTEVSLPSSSFIIHVSASAQKEVIDTRLRDVWSPDPFSLYLSKNETMFEGKWFIVFLTQDKGSGIDHYEVFEGKSRLDMKTRNAPYHRWKTVESPYVLQDQSRSSYVYIKAIDRVGNETISEFIPQESPSKRTWYWVVMGGIVLGDFVFLYERRKKRKNDNENV